jgi:hypothetical protein
MRKARAMSVRKWYNRIERERKQEVENVCRLDFGRASHGGG